MHLRNIAIIAHVDHGKTTLVDAILKQTGVFRTNQAVEDRVLDSNELERERGITILSKNIAVSYGGTKINIVDTPGHADFGGEVERIVSMVDGALLVVDAAEGPLPQTRYVLGKALAVGIRPIVVVNKIDRADARPKEVLDEIFELFFELGADDEQIDFPVLYACARDGMATRDLDEAMAAVGTSGPEGISPLLECVLTHVPSPPVSVSGPLQMLVTNLDHDDYVGRVAIGRIQRGKIKQGQKVVLCRGEDGPRLQGRVAHLFSFSGLGRVPAAEASAGDIVAIAGLNQIDIGDTVADPDLPEALPALKVDAPTLTVVFRVNDGPLAGRDGKYLTSRHLRERLFKEAQTNVALHVEDTDSPEAFRVSGRGELHLGILIETMRREGYEFTVSKPEVILKSVDGERHEPLEFVTVEVPSDYLGTAMELFGARKGEMLNMEQGDDGSVTISFVVPARGLIGFNSRFLTETRGFGIFHHTFHGYGPWRGDIPGRSTGSLVAWEAGVVTTYALLNLQDRGTFFVEPGTEVYEGMVVGEHSRPQDLDVNVARKRQVTNMRSATAEITERLAAPRHLALEEALAFIKDDELVEVTPKAFRLRKMVMTKGLRAGGQR